MGGPKLDRESSCKDSGVLGMKLTFDQKAELRRLYRLSQATLARLWRNAPAGHPYFDKTKPYFRHFKRRFKRLGGMTTQVSKQIGW